MNLKERVIFFSNTRIPSEKAHAKQIAEMCNALSKNFSLIFVTASRYQSNPSLKKTTYEKYFGYNQPDTKKIIFIDELHPLISLFKLRRIIFYMRTIYSALWLFFFSNKNDFIYTREFFVAVLLKKLRKKVFYEAHQIHTYQLNANSIEKIKFLLGNEIFELPIVAISKNLKRKLMELGFVKVLVAHDGVDNEVKSLTKNKLYDVVYTGQLFKEKGINLIISAAKKLSMYHFHIIGGIHEDVEKYIKVANENNIKNITFYGHISPVSVSEFQRKSKCLVLPQLNDNAESPLKLFEYMKSRSPIVASGTEPIKEILSHKKMHTYSNQEMKMSL